jgi:succinate dehydrogenase/fumarate reductase flavoprotein subunit
VWEQKKMQQPPRFPKLDRDLEVDVCIVGAGITGLSIAYALAKEGVHRSAHRTCQSVLPHRGVSDLVHAGVV